MISTISFPLTAAQLNALKNIYFLCAECTGSDGSFRFPQKLSQARRIANQELVGSLFPRLSGYSIGSSAYSNARTLRDSAKIVLSAYGI